MPLSRFFSRRSSNRTDSNNKSSSQSPSGSLRSRMSFRKTPYPTDSSTPSSSYSTNAQGQTSYNAYQPSNSNPFASPVTRRPNQPVQGLARFGGDAPPAYTDVVTETPDDPFAFLTQFDTVFLIDDSGSMAGRSWAETSAALAAIAPICTARDTDGVDVHFLNNKTPFLNVKDPARIQQIFNNEVKPWGATPTGMRLHKILEPYLVTVEAARQQGHEMPKPMNIIVITDGVATDDPESTIMGTAARLVAAKTPPWQVGIQFFQVGREPKAAETLAALDNDLVTLKCARDIVDTVPWNKGGGDGGLSADGVLKVVLGSVVRKLDRKPLSGEAARRK